MSGQSFGQAGDAYQRARPTYPADAVAWLLDGVPAGVVADVGAGTGKLTAVVHSLGYGVTAIDPDAEMLERLDALELAGVDSAVGTAEQLPLAAASSSALVFGQAWHWVDVPTATAEADRVLVDGGRIGLIWNIRDERVDWMRELGARMHHSPAERLVSSDGVRVDAPFERVAHETFEWHLPMDRTRVLDLVRSRSYFIASSPSEQAHTESLVNELLDELPELADGGTIAAPYVTHAYRYERV